MSGMYMRDMLEMIGIVVCEQLHHISGLLRFDLKLSQIEKKKKQLHNLLYFQISFESI